MNKDVLIPMLASYINVTENIVEKMVDNLTDEQRDNVFYCTKEMVLSVEELKKEKASLLGSNAQLRKDVDYLYPFKEQCELLKDTMIADKYGIELKKAEG